MANGANLWLFKLAAHAQHDGGGRILAVALEQLPLGNDEVDARGRHPVDRADRAC
jgi:hypothetical protein